jgi:toxin secretion/phage lysis holin
MDKEISSAAQMSMYIKMIFFAVSSYISWFLTYIGLDKEAIGIFACLILIDYVTGIAKARALKQSITSNKMKYGIISKISLIVLPITLALAAKISNEDTSIFFNLGINLLIVSETYSVIGNIYAIRTANELPEWDVVALLGKKIREKFGGNG